MKRGIFGIFVVFALVLASDAYALPQNRYISADVTDTDALRQVSGIALLEVPDPEAYYFGGGRPGVKTGLFGVVETEAGYVEISQHADQYSDTDFAGILQAFVAEFLRENDFQVSEHRVQRQDRFDLLPDYSSLELTGVDAYLDVVPVEIGYLYKPAIADEGIWPVATVIARLVSAHSGQVLFARTFQYGYHARYHPQSTKLLPPKSHGYESRRDLAANRPEVRQRLVRGLELVALNIAHNISGDKFASYLSPTREELNDDSSADTAARFFAAAATEIVMNTYHEKLWQQTGVLAGDDAAKRAEYYIKLRARHLAERARVEQLRAMIRPPGETAAEPAIRFDVSGSYVSEITSNSKWQFRQPYRKLKIELRQDGNRITGYDLEFGTRIRGSIDGALINFSISSGKAADGYDIDGQWRVAEDGSSITGSWKCRGCADDAQGVWNLIRTGSPIVVVENTAQPPTTVDQSRVDFSGHYVSEITSNSRWHFKKKFQRLRLVLDQDGEVITAVDEKYGTRIAGSVSGNTIEFHVEPGAAGAGYEIEGRWDLAADGSGFEGAWKCRGCIDDAKGTWRLTRAGAPIAVTDTPSRQSVTDDPLRVDLSGIYISEITSNSKWQFQKKYRQLRITLDQDGDVISGFDEEFGTRITGSVSGDTVEFHVEPGQANSGYGIDGQWKLAADGTGLNGVWRCRGCIDDAGGAWILRKIE